MVASPAAGPVILVVEDDRTLREFYITALKLAGYTVVACEDGLDALRWVEQHTPALILLDLMLIRVSGRDVQKELRSRAETRHIPIVVITGDDTRDLNPAELACIIRKPVSARALTDTVARCLASG